MAMRADGNETPAKGGRARRIVTFVALASLIAAPALAVGAPTAGATTSTCQPFGVVTVAGGAYNVQNNEWNSTAPQCVSTDGNADFSVTQSGVSAPTNSAPASYPSIYRGCHWGTCTQSSGLPQLVGGLADPTTTWSTTQPSAGTYDVAYDIWFNQSPTTSGQPNGAEVMVWLNHQGPVQPAGAPVGTVSLDGYSFRVWQAAMPTWTYVAYVIQGGTSSVTNLDLGNLLRDAESRGYLSPAWYLIDVEAGFELWQGGAGLATTAFSFDPAGTTPPTTGPTTTTSPPTSTTTAPSTTTTSPSTAGICSATYQVTGEWRNGSPPNGFTANVTVRNTGSTTTNRWIIGWNFADSGQQVTNAWNANVSQSGNAVTAANASYNGTISPGSTQTFGFQGAWTAADPPPSNLTCSASP